VPTRRRLLALASWALLAPTARAWSGHSATRSVVTITAEALRKLIESGRAPVFLVDLRSADAYRAGRLPGARSIPFEEIAQRFTELPPGIIVVLYCACSIVDVTPVYEMLRGHGYRNLVVLENGLGAWQARGYPVER
jgi:rhodanese-related sulfurtransferase